MLHDIVYKKWGAAPFSSGFTSWQVSVMRLRELPTLSSSPCLFSFSAICKRKGVVSACAETHLHAGTCCSPDCPASYFPKHVRLHEYVLLDSVSIMRPGKSRQSQQTPRRLMPVCQSAGACRLRHFRFSTLVGASPCPVIKLTLSARSCKHISL